MRHVRGAFVVAVLSAFNAGADTHYAAHMETNPWVRPSYPYTSPETAASYIMDAIDAADPGDTVMVLPGRYGWDGATYRVKDGVDLAGSGGHLTIMLGDLVVGRGSMLSGFKLLDNQVEAGSGAVISHCRFDGARVEVNGSAVVRRCTFTRAPTGWHGAISAMWYADALTVQDCVFDLGGQGYGISASEVQNGGMKVERCRFAACSTAISLSGSYGDVRNCLFVDNGLGIDTSYLDVSVENCTFYRNQWAITSTTNQYSQTFKNSIVWASRSGNVLEERKGYPLDVYMPIITFSDVEGGYPGRGNVDADPKFRWPSEDDPDLHLCGWSPCIDAGDPFTGLEHPGSYAYSDEPEPNGGRANMGAYGNTWEATTSELVDLDADNIRDDWEMENFGNLDHSRWDDPDDDGLGDCEEYRYLSDPNNPDTDGDGLLDGGEVYGFTVEDGEVVYADFSCDPILPDTDNDGTPDGKEVAQGTDPLDPWDAFTIIKFWIENDQVHVVHSVHPDFWYQLQSSFFPNGPFGTLVGMWAGRHGLLTHTFVGNINPHTRFFRVRARPF